MAAKVIFNR